MDKLRSAIDDELEDFLQEMVVRQLSTKPWEDRTGSLRAGHRIERLPDGSWMLEADPRDQSERDVDYAAILEYSLNPRTRRDWQWFYRVATDMTPDLPKRLAKVVEKVANK